MRKRQVSQGLIDLGRAIAAEHGIEPLKPGEARPSDFLCPNHYWGPTSLKLRATPIKDRPWWFQPWFGFLSRRIDR